VADYVLLMRWTERGLERTVPAEDEPAGDALTGLGERLADRLAQFNAGIISLHWTLGPYDMVAVVEADSDAVIAGVVLYLAQSEGVQSTTMRGFQAEEMGGGEAAGEGVVAETSRRGETVAEVNYRCHY
jgi:uncharacterized protein with GYD domain